MKRKLGLLKINNFHSFGPHTSCKLALNRNVRPWNRAHASFSLLGSTSIRRKKACYWCWEIRVTFKNLWINQIILLPGGEILHTNHGDERIAISLETTPSSICFSFSENLNWISSTIKITLIIFPPFKLLWAAWLFFFNSDGKRFNSNLQHWSVQAYPVINSSFYKSKYCSKTETLVIRAML